MARWRILRWLLWAGLAMVGLLAVAVLSSPVWLGPLAAGQASKALGRPVEVGRLQLRPGSPLVITAEDVVIGNPGDFLSEEAPFLRIPRLTLRLEAGAYLRRREIVIPLIELEKPVASAVSAASGQTNYGFGDDLAGDVAGPKIGAIRILDGRARVSLAELRADFELARLDQGGGQGTDRTRSWPRRAAAMPTNP